MISVDNFAKSIKGLCQPCLHSDIEVLRKQTNEQIRGQVRESLENLWRDIRFEAYDEESLNNMQEFFRSTISHLCG